MEEVWKDIEGYEGLYQVIKRDYPNENDIIKNAEKLKKDIENL